MGVFENRLANKAPFKIISKVEVVVAKLDKWWRLFLGKAKFGRIRKTGFGRSQSNNQIKSSIVATFLCCLGGLSGVVKVCTYRTTACEAIGGLRVEALSGSLLRRRRSSRGKIGQLAEVLFGESKI